MEIFELSFSPKVMNQEYEDLLGQFVEDLVLDGKVSGKGRNALKTENSYVYRLIVPEKESLDIKLFNEDCAMDWADITEFSVSEPKIAHIGEAMGMEPVCSCRNPSHYILFTMNGRGEPPVICGDCLKPVPLYRFKPTLDNVDYADILAWDKVYKACDAEFMGGIGERHAFKMMSDYSSALSEDALKICGELERTTKKPVYYFLFKYYTNPKKTCPKCGENWENFDEKYQYDFVCHNCRLVSNLI